MVPVFLGAAAAGITPQAMFSTLASFLTGILASGVAVPYVTRVTGFKNVNHL